MWTGLLLLGTIRLAMAFHQGAGNCDAENLPVPMNPGTENSVGWSLSVNPSGFAVGTNVTITINGPGTFRGVNAYIEDSVTNALFGSWTTDNDFQPNPICSASAGVTHKDGNNPKPSGTSIKWTAPNTNPGTSALAVRVLVLYQGSPNARLWAKLSATIANNNIQSLAPTSAPTTGAPTTSAPSMGPTCTDGLKGPTEIGVDCGGPCPPCATYVWLPGGWTPCSVECGGGTQTRAVNCVNGATGVIVGSGNCTGTHNAETAQSCNPDPCPMYSWNIGPYGACSAPCNTGTMTRAVTCMSSLGNVTVADSFCGSGSKPLTDSPCNTDACTGYHWDSTLWNLCSQTCGGGTQTRVVQCKNATDFVVSDGACTDPLPPSQQMCNTQSCTFYIWNPCPEFYPCTATCNGGTGMLGIKYKDVFCVDGTTTSTVDPSLCNNDTKPITNVSVCNTQTCSGPNWMANGNWGPCMQQNGKFVRTRTFHCHTADGQNALPATCKDVPQPAGELECVVNTCLKFPPTKANARSVFAMSSLIWLSIFLAL